MEMLQEWPPEMGFAQWIGTREAQNDAVYLSPAESARGVMIALADGIGLDPVAGDAARAAVLAMKDEFEISEDAEPLDQVALRIVGGANARIRAMNGELEAKGEMHTGATVACVVVRNRQVSCSSIGNTRVFLFRCGRLLQLNRDHLLSQEAEERDILAGRVPDISPDWALRVTAYAGMDDLKMPDWQQTPIALKADDQLMVMSSGLYGALEEEELCSVLAEMAPQLAADEIIRRVKARNQASQSNISLAILRVGARRRRAVPGN